MSDLPDFTAMMEHIEGEVYSLRSKSTKLVMDYIHNDILKRFPKRRFEILFGMGGQCIWADGVIRHEGDRNAMPFQDYYDLLNQLDETHWDNCGVCTGDLIIVPHIENHVPFEIKDWRSSAVK